ncbi:MAG: peptidoglycan-binding protein [Leptothrix sp. (in: b-proteobacteria)]
MVSGAKTKLLMTRYKVNAEGTITLEPSVRYEALINPAEFKHSTGISYDKGKTLGEAAASPKFASVNEETVSFSLVLDGTGVLPGSGRSPASVKSHIEQLNTVVYNYVGSQHEPPHVRLLWGTLIFFGRLQSMSTQYTLFKPSGEPLRAKLDLSFVGSMSKQESKLVANRSSPDLTHSVVVRQGDTLPLLCQRIYGDPGYYLDVAAFNGLPSFRDLQAGSQLHFPPLE